MLGSTLTIRYPQASDASEYAYGTDHAIVHGSYREESPATNRVRVIGAAVSNEAFDFAEIEALGERIDQVFDINLTTASSAADRASYELRAAEVRSHGDELLMSGVNCGQDLFDVVSLTDPQAGLENVKRRVLALSWRYSTGEQPHYDMTLTLGEP
jgi:hypothetical protein